VDEMFREKFILTFALTFVIEIAAFVVVLLVMEKGFSFWFWQIWSFSFAVAAGLDWSLVIYIGWDYLNPTESRLPVYVGMVASLIVALIYKGITLLIKIL
jgi:hypothetical protein